MVLSGAGFKFHCHQFLKIFDSLIARAFVQDSLNQGRLVVGLVQSRHHFCAMQGLLEHAKMLQSMCSGMDSTHVNLLMKRLPKVCWNRDLISSRKATHSCFDSLCSPV